MKPIILASSSPQRKELLAMLGLAFQTVTSDYEEDMSAPMKPAELSVHLSSGKAEAVAKKHPKHLVIAADTFVAFGNELLGKPQTEPEAVVMLNKISGHTLSVITGYTIFDAAENKKVSRSVSTKVRIKNLTNEEIDNYVKTKEPLDKAGAFAIQGFGASIVEKVSGDYYNVIGLPLASLALSLKIFGLDVTNNVPTPLAL